MARMLDAHLRRVDWKVNVPLRLYPFLSEGIDGEKIIAIDPALKFGRPVLVSRGISTSIIVERIEAGESIETLAKDYKLDRGEIDAAIVYEKAA